MRSHRSDGAGLHGDCLHNRAVAFVPDLDGVGTSGLCRFGSAHRVCHGEVGIRHNTDVRVHPVVDVALEMKHHLFVLRLELIHLSGARLR